MNPLEQDAAVPQAEYLELWESTRFRQDQPQQQQLIQNQVQSYQQQDVSIQNQDRNSIAGDVRDNPHCNLEAAQREPTWLSPAQSRQPDAGVDGEQNFTIGTCLVCSSRFDSCMCSSTAMHGGGSSSSTAFLEQNGYAFVDQLGAGIGCSSYLGEQSELQFPQQAARTAKELNLSAAHGRENAPQGSFPELGQQSGADGVPSYTGKFMAAEERTEKEQEEWEELRRRCLIVTHPRYQEMLERHAECLRVGTPLDQLPTIEAQLKEAATVTEKYRALRDQIAETTPDEQAELDEFMCQYPPMLGGFRDVLQEHVHKDVTEAMMSCWELEQALKALTGSGVRLEDVSGATMSDDDVEDYDSDYGSYDQGNDFNDSGGFGPLVPTPIERTLMERVRQELKHELKQGYKSKIEDVREEILRKRRAGKLPEGSTTVLKAWWQAHAKWPYPTEDEKEILIEETGLELKQVNNWFINQRKRNWHNNPLASAQASDSGKNKARKSW